MTDKNEKTLSEEDLIFFQKLDPGKQTAAGHFEMPLPLPFRERPQMPDKRQLKNQTKPAQLRCKLMNDKKYKEEYMKYKSDIIERGDAEENEDVGPSGETWPPDACACDFNNALTAVVMNVSR